MSAAMCSTSAGLVPVFIAFLVLHFLYADITSAVVTCNCFGDFGAFGDLLSAVSVSGSVIRFPSQIALITSLYA